MKECFYKYADIVTVRAVLENQSFRYSSPLVFNDPFDVQTELMADYNLDELPKKAMAVIEEAVKSDYDVPNPNYGFSKGILLIREKAKIQGYKKAEIEQITIPLLELLLGQVKCLISNLNDYWNKLMQESRVFCVTEDKDNLLMWAHYAKYHTGAVFQIATLPERDTILSVARPVQYEDRPFRFYSMEELIKSILFDVDLDIEKILFFNHAHRKSKIWEYEKEWRVVNPCQYPNKNDLYVDLPFVPEQLQRLYFGCKACDKEIESLMELAKEINPKVKFYRAKKSKGAYVLTFVRI